MSRLDCGEGEARIREVLKLYPWLLPVLWLFSQGSSGSEIVTADSASRILGVPKRLARTLLHYAAKAGVAEREVWGYRAPSQVCIEVRRSGRYYAAVVGSTVYVAKTLARRVRWFTVPIEYLENVEALQGKARFRAVIAKKVLEA
ncbi:hypothetical protein [Aeropyrum camini]|uniref:Uncharacterized protein n=1 Tax=Aeropyrum camini SY1 = JCM 12091 TaxID=1198449 RepID=U3TEM5_9CREN|nr:hypothetical protein [Aeropyrum camini]BAN90485.1 hypothetical protein ACAM_1016 [Aeropyrum camini SY1 = JCM 12091]